MTNYWNDTIDHDKEMREILKDKPAFPPACQKDQEEYIEKAIRQDSGESRRL